MHAKTYVAFVVAFLFAAAPAEAASFKGTQVGPTEWVYTLTYDPFDNFAVCPAPNNVATITLSGLSGVVGASAPTSTDFQPPIYGDLLWLPSVSSDGTSVTWTHVGSGTGNFDVPKHVFGFSIRTGTPVPTGLVRVASTGFSLDVSRSGPCPPTGSVDRNFTGATQGPTTSPVPAPPPVRPVIGTFKLAPAARPGTTVAVTFPVTRSDTGAPLLTGTMVCRTTLAGALIAHREEFRNGVGRVVLALPKSSGGKQLKVRVTIRVDDETTTKVAVFRVAPKR